MATFTATDQDARVARAMREDFDWTTYDSREWICTSESGNEYLVSEEACTCPDWEKRCSHAGARCKHQVALGHKLIADGALTVAKGLRMTREEEISAKLSRDLGRDVTWTERDERAFNKLFG